MKEKEKGKVCKKVISVLSIIAILAGGIPFSSEVRAADSEDNGSAISSDSEASQNLFRYGTIEGGIRINGYTGDAEILEIPEQIDGEKVISIGYGAFENCKNIIQVVIPEGVSYIAANAFDGCSNLAKVTIPSSVTDISINFSGCYNLENLDVAEENEIYASEDGVLFNKEKSTLLLCPRGKKGQYTVPATVTKIDFMAFEYSDLTDIVIQEGLTTVENDVFFGSSIESISLPDSLTAISSGMFYDCDNLKTLYIPKGVSKIGSDAFGSCENIEFFSVSEDSTYFSAIEGVLFNKAKTKVVKCPPKMEGKYTLPSTVTSIDGYAFANCQKLTEISMPSKVTAIGDAAFMGCSNLIDVTIPENVSSIGEAAFSGCTNLAAITFNKNTKTIKANAFSDCEKLESVTLPQNLNSIKKNAFLGCTNLVSVEIASENTSYISIEGVLYNKEMTELVICPNGKKDNLNLPEGITSLVPENTGILASEILDGCQITSITLPSTYAGFSDSIYRFGGCTALEEINVSRDHEDFCSVDGVVYEKNMKKVVMCPQGRKREYKMPDTVEEIYKYAFYKCKNLTDVTISKNVSVISYNNFYQCVMDSVVIPEGVAKIEGYAFEGCTIKKLCIPKSVSAIDKTAYGFEYDMWDMVDKKLENQPVIGCEKDSFAYSDAITKGLTVELAVSILIKDYKPDKKYDGLAIENPGENHLTLNSVEYNELIFTWYRDSVVEVNKLKTMPVNAGTYILVISIEENAERKGVSVQRTVKIEKADQPSTMPASKIQTAFTSKTVKDVSLPKNWAWQSKDMEKPLNAGTEVTATAEYVGSDKGNYEKETVKVSITRLNDTSDSNLKKGQTFTDKKSKAVYTVTKAGKKNGCVTYTKLKNANAKSVTVPSVVTINGVTYKVTAIAANAFKSNKKITSISIGSNVMTIGNRAFYKCVSIKKVTIPAKVNKIGKQAFYGCKNLKTINIKTTKLTSRNVGSQAFKKINTKASIKVPKRKLTSYKKILRAKGVSTKAKIKK